MPVNCIHCAAEIENPALPFCEACGKPWAGAAPAHAALVGSGAGAVVAGETVCAKCGEAAVDADGVCGSCGAMAPTWSAADVQALNDQVASATDRGRKHPDNQDAVALFGFPDGQVAIVVADGVSTSYAAQLAAQTVVQRVVQGLQDHAALAPTERLQRAIDQAHAAVCQLDYDARTDSGLAEPQATVVAALVGTTSLAYAWVGDSRIYLFGSNGSARQLSVDDSVVGERLASGMALQEAMQSPDAHCITQCLGMRDQVPQVHVQMQALTPGDTVVLCSDGLWNYFGEAGQLGHHFSQGRSQETMAERCARLVGMANMSGGQDNITIAACRVASPSYTEKDQQQHA